MMQLEMSHPACACYLGISGLVILPNELQIKVIPVGCLLNVLHPFPSQHLLFISHFR